MTTTECPQENGSKELGRRNVVPIIYVRGTHYEIGFDIGRTFAKLISDFVDKYRPLNETYLAQYETPEGRKIYDETLAVAEQQYPGYVREIRGTADGAGVPFHKLFLMHLDDIVPNVASGTTGNDQPVGCSSIICNQPGQEILGHNEDALSETLNYWYLVSAHVVEPDCKEERFTSLSYAGFLPGYTMGYNQHGLVYSINTLSAASLRSAKTPRYFLTRALLAAADYEEAERTLRNEGYGAAEGFSVNLTFLGETGDRVFRNIEIGPCGEDCKESQMDILTLNSGDFCFHCNTYIRLQVPEVEGLIINSSVKRMAAICKHPAAKSRQDVIDILSDQSDDQFRVYQEIKPDDYVKTIATGIFDCIEKTWSIYTDKPDCNEPMLVMPLQLCDKVSPPMNGEQQTCETCEDTQQSEEATKCQTLECEMKENGETKKYQKLECEMENGGSKCCQKPESEMENGGTNNCPKSECEMENGGTKNCQISACEKENGEAPQNGETKTCDNACPRACPQSQ